MLCCGGCLWRVCDLRRQSRLILRRVAVDELHQPEDWVREVRWLRHGGHQDVGGEILRHLGVGRQDVGGELQKCVSWHVTPPNGLQHFASHGGLLQGRAPYTNASANVGALQLLYTANGRL